MKAIKFFTHKSYGAYLKSNGTLVGDNRPSLDILLKQINSGYFKYPTDEIKEREDGVRLHVMAPYTLQDVDIIVHRTFNIHVHCKKKVRHGHSESDRQLQ